MKSESTASRATLHRMVMPGHVCPYGLKALHLLRSRGFAIEDRWLTDRAAVEAFKARHEVATTPQVVIDGRWIGGHDALRRHLGLKVAEPGSVSYRPVAALFALTALAAAALGVAVFGTPLHPAVAGWFIALSMVVLALLKLQDVDRFATMFLNYDLLAQRWVPYATLYPFLEALAGILMLSGHAAWISVPVALFIGTIGAASVFKAVYIERRTLKCACVGGNSNVPLGFVSLLENVMMVGMALAMIAM